MLGDALSRLGQVPLPDRNLLILVSMVNFLTGVVRFPFTTAILVLEMTDRHSAIFQLLRSGRMAPAVAPLVDPHSFSEHLKIGFLRETLAQPASPGSCRTTRPEPPEHKERP